jgi:PAS domain S-box-containing protein
MSGELRLLILEDRPADAELAMRELRDAGIQFVAKCVATEADFLAQLRDSPPDLILADYSLPAYDGLTALASVQKECPEIPFVFVSGTLGEETAIEALHQGATDYVLKQRLSRLGPAVQRAMREIGERTRRRQAEELLRASERNYREIFNATNDALFLHDAATGAILDVNQMALDMFGYTREEMPTHLPGDPLSAGGPFSHEEAVRQVRQAAAAGPQVFEWHSKRKNGELFWSEIALRAANIGGQDRVLAVVRDITGRKAVEEALRNSEHRSRILFEYAPDAYSLYDLQGKFVDGNKAAEALSGYQREELIGKSFLELNLLTPEGIALAATRLAQNARGEPAGPDEFTFRRKDGSEVTIEVCTYPVRFGDEVLVLGTTRDITPRKNAERALAESREFRQAILDKIPDPAWLKDTQGRFLACNEPLAQLCGLKAKDVIGKTAFDIIPAEAERLMREDQEVAATRKPIRVERPLTDALGRKRWFDTIKSPILNERGEVTSVVGISRETTERRQTDEALRVSEERFRSIWEHSIDGMRLTDREGRILAVNDAFCRFVKLPPEKLIGEVFSVAYEGHGLEEVEAYRRHFEAGTFAPRMTEHFRLWNSEDLDVEVSSSFVESGSQSKTLLSIFRDVAERKRAEARVAAVSHLGHQLSTARSAREAGEIIVAAADRLLGWDACTFDLYSAEKERLSYVLNRDTINGQRVDFPPVCPDGPPALHDRRVIEAGGQLILKEGVPAMLPGAKPFGDTARPSASIMLVPARAGAEVVGILSLHSYAPKAYDERGLETLQMLADHCAGALKRISAQEALAVSEANYRSLVERSPDAILLHRDGAFVYANPASLKLFGATKPQQLLGRQVFDIVPPENRELIGQRIAQAAEGGMTPLLEQRVLRLDGTAFDAEAISIPFVYEGKPAVQTIMRDITGRKLLEHQLRQSQKMEAIGQLAGGVAHDFNNMLAVIRGNAELLLMDADQHASGTNECLKQIMAASERAANLTRQLLVFSRKQVMQSQPLALNKVIAELTKMLKRIIGEHIDLECRYADPLPFVQADAGMLEQVLLNLAVNARDAMPRGGHLLIATDTASFDAAYSRNHPGAGTGEFVRLTVTDTGTGIAPEHLPRIFEPFFTTKELGKGTGLGLATVYGIVQQHQGWIEVSSQPGAGATFKIFLPVIPSPAVTAAASKAETQVPGGAETILLVEDEYAVRAVTRRVLESQGYRIYEATTVREALEVWRSHAEEVELLLTDIVMPQGLTGRELAEQLRAQRPALKVIFMSGYSADVVGKDTGFFRRTKSSFLQKPCSARTILETVRRCLDEK